MAAYDQTDRSRNLFVLHRAHDETKRQKWRCSTINSIGTSASCTERTIAAIRQPMELSYNVETVVALKKSHAVEWEKIFFDQFPPGSYYDWLRITCNFHDLASTKWSISMSDDTQKPVRTNAVFSIVAMRRSNSLIIITDVTKPIKAWVALSQIAFNSFECEFKYTKTSPTTQMPLSPRTAKIRCGVNLCNI